MAEIMTLERIERDEDDETGKDVRSWHISISDGMITMRSRADSDDFIMIKESEIDQFQDDLTRLLTA